ncbi:MAG: anaerobic glycerol-3-phosphate dehydrogenase subunit C [Anaerolineales bacterium]|nr:anaerobic glycerol-3-phosphate dehydrogenase subunit C [Anaerolineales bacterium]
MKLTTLNDIWMKPGLTADQCIKCNICNTACPVLAVTDDFLGPKAVGPQFERFRHPRLPIPEDSVSLCSGCGTCSRVCPHGVSVAEMNSQAKARLVDQNGAPLRDQLLSRPELLGKLNRRWAGAANQALKIPLVRQILESTLGISKQAPLPGFSRDTFRDRHPERCISEPPETEAGLVAYYHGCSVNHYEPDLGDLTLEILGALGYEVVLPPQKCCGLPLQSNGLFEAARSHAGSNLETLQPFVDAGIPIVGTSTSCTLELKHEYQAVLGLRGVAYQALGEAVADLFEFLLGPASNRLLAVEFEELPLRVLYHAPCQLKSHWIGTPAFEIMKRMPALEILLSRSECCGVAGTYGVKKEKYGIARDVGQKLFEQAQEHAVDFVVTDSETCRWWIRHHTQIPSVHPAALLAVSMGLRSQVLE